MIMRSFKFFRLLLLISKWYALCHLTGSTQAYAKQIKGSCNFERSNSVCGYQQPNTNNFDWSRLLINGSFVMMANASGKSVGNAAKLITPKIDQQETHCITFNAFVMKKEINFHANNASDMKLKIYLQDTRAYDHRQAVWSSASLLWNEWKLIQLAFTPSIYKIVFEAIVQNPGPGYVLMDNVLVSNSACESAPHFMRLSEKTVNSGQDEIVQCLLWGHSSEDTNVILQKSTGETKFPFSKQEIENHLNATFRFSNVTLAANGTYRCVSNNPTQVGVSNYALLSVKVPPTPKRGPQVTRPGATNFVVNLNTEEYDGDGPIVKTILTYRPVGGSWADIHLITKSVYKLWHLQPDTEYELAVNLVRPGAGGKGAPGPILTKKTKCGRLTSPVQNVVLNPVTSDPNSMKLQWDAPGFSVTQCNNFASIVKYKPYVDETNSGFKKKRVEKNSTAVIGGLKPFTKYIFKVELINSGGWGAKETGEFVAQTGEGVPGPVPSGSIVVKGENETAISVSWDKPDEINGKLKKYKIYFRGTDTFDPVFMAVSDLGFYELSTTEHSLVLGNLHPGTTYQISIQAETGAGFGPAVNVSAQTEIAPPTVPHYPLPSDDQDNTTVTPTTIEITLIPAQSYGAPITNYYVIVEEDISSNVDNQHESKSKRESEKGEKHMKTFDKELLVRGRRQVAADTSTDVQNRSSCFNEPTTYDDAVKDRQPLYAAAKFDAEQVKQEFKFVVGDNSNQNGYLNAALDPNKDYKIYVRVESEANGKKTVNCVLVALKRRLPHSSLAPTTAAPPTSFPNEDNIPALNNAGDEETGFNSTLSPGEKKPAEQDQNMLYAGIGVALLLALIVGILLILLLIKKKRRKQRCKDEVVNPFEVRMVMSNMASPAHTLLPNNLSDDRQALMPDLVGYEHQEFFEKSSDGAGKYAATSNDERFAVRVDDFHVHVSQMKSSGGFGFRDEYSTFPDGANAPWIVADNPINKRRNRYGNIMAYDHSRVVLEPPEDCEEEFESDYINASYINGYKTPSLYIATQAPTSETLADFWWMIWQEKCTVLVMLTNLVELGKQKCTRYWPDERGTYGRVEVTMNSEERLADHVIRTFILQQIDGYDVREVKQFHFTSWPDHGVPSRPTNLLSFIRRVKNYEPQGQGPMIVHCSAGSGRTGCFIVVDMMLDMAREEEIVDIYNTVRELRSRRVNMVQTEEQYVFIHEAVLEALLCGETSVPARDLAQHYDDLITVDPQTHFAPIQEEFQTLHVITPQLADDECSVARLPRNRASNRFMDVLPADRHLAYLVTPDPQDVDNNYINAVFVDSFLSENNLLVSQMPLPNTVVDLWRLVYDHNCSSIVMMNDVSEHDQTCSQYWPDSGSAIFGPFTVELLTKDDEVDVISRLFKIQNVTKPGEPYRLVHQFQLNNWPAAQPVPYARNSVLRIIQLVTSWRAESMRNGGSGRVLVHCVAGAGRSGTFVSCFNICQQLEHENMVDVFNIVQRLRNIRPQLVETLEQYRFCYEVGIEFSMR